MSAPLHWIVAIVALFGLGSWMALAAHESGANAAPAAEPAIDCKSTRAARKACAARDLCQSIYGPDAMHFWTRDGDLVCRRSMPMT